MNNTSYITKSIYDIVQNIIEINQSTYKLMLTLVKVCTLYNFERNKTLII